MNKKIIQMKKNLNLLTLLIIAIVFGSCKNKFALMKENADKVNIEVKPNPLEMHPNEKREYKVSIAVSGKFPQEYFDKNARVIITPVLKTYTGEEIPLKAKTIIGENVRDNEDMIKYEAGGSFRLKFQKDYKEAMRISELIVRAKAMNEKKGKEFNFPEKKIADGVMTTVLLAQRGIEVDNMDASQANVNNSSEFGKLSKKNVSLPETSTDIYKSSIHYAIQRSNISSSEKKNKELIDMFAKAVEASKKDLALKGIEISSYASPDGPTDLNTNLSGKRGQAAEKYVEKEIKKLNEKLANKLDAQITGTTTAEDWEGFKEIMNSPETNVKDKQLILRVLNMYTDPEVREREIKNIAEAYNELKTEVLPQLRRSQIRLEFESNKKTPEQLTKLVNTSPEDLTNVELLYAATLTNDLNKKEATYKKTIELYPKDWIAYNNLGTVYLNQNKKEEAKKQFEKANSIKKNQFSMNNLGSMELAKGNIDKAEEMFNSALELGTSEATADINYNLGYIALSKGDYNSAKRYFGSQKTFNASLAQLLGGDANLAFSTLNAMPEKDHAFYYYLKAVIGARLSKEDVLYANLKKATDKENALKEYAKYDIEFKKYFKKNKFKKIVK